MLNFRHELRRPLLLIHGTTDDNVYLTHSLRMSDALFRAGAQHEFLPLSNFTHMVADPLVTMRLNQAILRFFQRNLVDGEKPGVASVHGPQVAKQTTD